MPFEFEGRVITARPLSIADADAIGLLLNKYPDGQRTQRILWFLEFAVGGVVQGEPLFASVGKASSLEELEAAYQGYSALPRTFTDWWTKELAAVENPPKVSASQTSTD